MTCLRNHKLFESTGTQSKASGTLGDVTDQIDWGFVVKNRILTGLSYISVMESYLVILGKGMTRLWRLRRYWREDKQFGSY